MREKLLNLIENFPLKFVMCHTHKRHANEMTKIWLRYFNSVYNRIFQKIYTKLLTILLRLCFQASVPCWDEEVGRNALILLELSCGCFKHLL